VTPTLNTSSSNLNKQAHNSKPASGTATVARDQVVAAYDFNGETNFDLSFKVRTSIFIYQIYTRAAGAIIYLKFQNS
jgi:hypothetical protein